MTIGTRTLMSLVDELGDLQATILGLQQRADEIKDQLKAEGAGQYRGKQFVVLVKVADRTTVSWAKVAEALHAPEDLVAQFSKTATVATAEVKPLSN